MKSTKVQTLGALRVRVDDAILKHEYTGIKPESIRMYIQEKEISQPAFPEVVYVVC